MFHRSKQSPRKSRGSFVKRAGQTMRLNTRNPLRGGIRL